VTHAVPDVVTFWEGPLDALRRLCLRSQTAAGHRVTVYSFTPIAALPEGILNADAAAILPRAFAERLRPSAPDGSWRGWTPLQFSDFFRMRLLAEGKGLWLDADVLLLKPVTYNSEHPFFAWEKPRQIGNSALYLPSHSPIVAAFERLIAQDQLTPDWLAWRHRLTFRLNRIRGQSDRVSDVRVAIFGPAALTALARRAGQLHHARPKKTFYAVHARPNLFFDPSDFSELIADPAIAGFHISPKGRGNDRPVPGSMYAWAAERFGSS